MLEPSLDDETYMERVASLSFEDVEWTPEQIAAVRDFLAPWHHNIRLADGIYTAHREHLYPAHEEVMSTVAHELGGTFAGVRILDLGCLEGYFAIETALQGAEVIGVEGKVLNLKKCEFVKSVLGVGNVSFQLGDVMDVTAARFESFDAVLALGLLYHLEDPFTFVENAFELCRGFLVIDTLVAFEQMPESIDGWKPELSPLREFDHRGRAYAGRLYREFESGAPQLGKDLSPAASLRNEHSAWLTEKALVQLLRDVGFEQVKKLSYGKREDLWWADEQRDARVLLVAVKHRKQFRSRVFG